MSDDTPTQRLDAAGDSPTERFTAPATAEVPLGVAEERKSRKLIIILASIGGALLLAVLIVLIVLLTRGNSTPGALPSPSASGTASASPTPSASPTQTPTQTQPAPPPPPPSTDTAINDFSGTTQISCNSSAPVTPDYSVYLQWQTSNASQVFFGIGTNDAQQGPLFDNLPASGNSEDDFSGFNLVFPCPSQSETYALTAIGPGGQKVTETIVVQNTGDTQ